MRIILFVISICITYLLSAQNLDDINGEISNNETVLRIITNDSIIYDEYDDLIGLYLKNDIDSAIWLIKEGLPKKGGAILYTYFVDAAFYTIDSLRYLELIEFADSIIGETISFENKTYCEVLRHMYLDDQKYRQKMAALMVDANSMKDSANIALAVNILSLMNNSDLKNAKVLDSLLNVYKTNLFYSCPCDVSGVRAISLVIIHADQTPLFQKKIITKYKKQALFQLGADNYAFLCDRCMVNLGKTPIYYQYNPKNVAVDNLKKINRRRKRIGIDPLQFN